MNIFVEGTLPIAIKLLNGQTELKLKKFEMSAITVQQALNLHQTLKPDQYTGIAEMCEQIKLIDEDGNRYELAYEALVSSSNQNLKYIQDKKNELDVKEQAES